MRHLSLAAIQIILACSACALPGRYQQDRTIIEPTSVSTEETRLAPVSSAGSDGLHPGKLLLIAVGIVCAALVLVLIIQGPHL